jgi:hypothetical protein
MACNRSQLLSNHFQLTKLLLRFLSEEGKVRRGMPTDISFFQQRFTYTHGKNTQFKCSHICPRLCTDLCPLKHDTFCNQRVHLNHVCSPASTLQSSPMLPEVDDIDCNGSTSISLNRGCISHFDFSAMSLLLMFERNIDKVKVTSHKLRRKCEKL